MIIQQYKENMNSNCQKAIQICRVYTPPKTKHGKWILIDKLWPRALKKEAIDFDLWLKDITPSTGLRKWFHESPKERWREFTNQYIEELNQKKQLIEKIQSMAKHSPITLFYAAKDTSHNHAIILQEVLLSWPNMPNSESFQSN